jgi:uncharacterized membrane protein YdjX (TVP38/TMEM64 family)
MKARTAIKIAIVVFIAAVVTAIYFSPLRTHFTRDHIHADIEMLRGLWYAPIALILGYALGCIFAVPASIFIIAAGVVWGWKVGSVYALAGGMLGATVSYFVGRFLGEGVLQKFGRAGQMVESQVKSAGFKTMLVVRLIPGPPFAVWNYGAGVANVRFRDYFFGTLLGTAPAHILFCYCADALYNGTMTEAAAMKRLAVVAALFLMLVALPSIVKKFASR